MFLMLPARSYLHTRRHLGVRRKHGRRENLTTWPEIAFYLVRWRCGAKANREHRRRRKAGWEWGGREEGAQEFLHALDQVAQAGQDGQVCLVLREVAILLVVESLAWQPHVHDTGDHFFCRAALRPFVGEERHDGAGGIVVFFLRLCPLLTGELPVPVFVEVNSGVSCLYCGRAETELKSGFAGR